MKYAIRKNRGLFAMTLFLLVIIVLVLGAGTNPSKNDGKKAELSDDPPVCYTVDRSRPEWLGAPTSVEPDLEEEQGELLPKEFGLDPSHPNPFNPITTINFQVPKSSRVTKYSYTQDCHDLVSVTDVNAHTYQYMYNDDYAVISVVDPLEQNAFQFDYTWIGSGTTQVTDGNGHLSHFVYDQGSWAT